MYGRDRTAWLCDHQPGQSRGCMVCGRVTCGHPGARFCRRWLLATPRNMEGCLRGQGSRNTQHTQCRHISEPATSTQTSAQTTGSLHLPPSSPLQRGGRPATLPPCCWTSTVLPAPPSKAREMLPTSSPATSLSGDVTAEEASTPVRSKCAQCLRNDPICHNGRRMTRRPRRAPKSSLNRDPSAIWVGRVWGSI